MGTAQQRPFGVQVETLSGLHWIGVLMAALSGVIHFFLGVASVSSESISAALGVAFLLAGLGFLGAVALVLLNIRRRLVYAVGLPFTVIQVVLWYYINFAAGSASFPGDVGTMGAIDKVAQVVLIVVLVVLLQRD